GIAVGNLLQRGDQAGAVRAAFGHVDGLPGFCGRVVVATDPPLRHFTPAFGIISERGDAYPALDAERGDDAPHDDHDGIKSSGRRLGGLLDQAGDRVGHLGAVLDPVLEALGVDHDAFFALGRDRVVVPDTLDEATVATVTLVGSDNVEEGAL